MLIEPGRRKPEHKLKLHEHHEALVEEPAAFFLHHLHVECVMPPRLPQYSGCRVNAGSPPGANLALAACHNCQTADSAG
jgi:hypothetical protein